MSFSAFNGKHAAFFALIILLLLLAGALTEMRKPLRGGEKHNVVEVAVFEGGFGLDWHRDVARRYEKTAGEGVKVNLWGDPRVSDKVKPRILRGDPPDVVCAVLPFWRLVVTGKILPLNETLDKPAFGQTDKKWRDTFLPCILDAYTYKGKVYAAPLVFYMWVMWYDRRQFREHGWEVPRTWNELLALCEKIKAAGIAPVAFQGKYPNYAYYTLLTLYQRWAGAPELIRLENYEPGIFVSPQFIQAAKMLQDFALKYHQKGCMAMSHTESQMEFVRGRAAMVACGVWLEKEMADVTPKDFEMDCFNFPPMEGGKGDPGVLIGGGDQPFFVFSDASNAKEGMEFMRFMFSRDNMREFSSRVGTLNSLTGALDTSKASIALKSAAEIAGRVKRVVPERLYDLYLEWNAEVLEPSLSKLIAGEITPEEFGRQCEEGAQKTRNNPDIIKADPLAISPEDRGL